MYIAITGRETELAHAELETIFGKITPLNKEIVAIDAAEIIPARLEYLGFCKKFANTVIQSTDKNMLADSIASAILDNSTSTGKLSFGISWYCDQTCDKRMYTELAKKIKKLIQDSGRSARFIQPKDLFQLNAAQIHFNKLLKKGCEIVLYGNSNSPSVAITKWAFNPSSYSHRDYDRPVRSAKVGMFPPKLAQVLINLAKPEPNDIVCDPFCGSGVVLQEALFAGHNVIGADSSDEMVLATQKNLEWFRSEFHNSHTFTVNQSDARNFNAPEQSYVVVSEGYLGPALSEKPDESLLVSVKSNLEKLYIDFLKNILRQTYKPKSIVITIPFWQTTTGISHLKVIDQINDLGYTIRQFSSVDSQHLLYKRSQQIVGRQVLVLELK